MISYIGGKSKMADWIGEHIPIKIETYVEVFGGAFWVYVNGIIYEKINLKNVIYNDVNKFMVNLFECCKNPETFYDHICNVKVQDKILFDQFQKEINEQKDFNIPDYNLAMKYAYLATQVFSGSKIMSSSFMEMANQKSKFDSFRDRLNNPITQRKLLKITACENMDYKDVILKYDSPTTFFYVDPPYWKTENYYSNHNFDREDHEILCSHLKNIKGKFALSYYDFPILGKWLPKEKYQWFKKSYAKCASGKKGIKQNKGTEILILNYKIPQLSLFE